MTRSAHDNEERSARLAEHLLADLRVDDDVVAEVARLVRLTADHEAADDDPDGAVLCDADLAILAADETRYADYVAGVREEYAHVPDDDFARGRAAVLRALMAQPSLFRTPTARASWETAARANVTAELTRLDPLPRDPLEVDHARLVCAGTQVVHDRLGGQCGRRGACFSRASANFVTS